MPASTEPLVAGLEADASPASGGDGDTSARPKKSLETLERVRERLEQMEEEYSPQETSGNPDGPESETAVPRTHHNVLERIDDVQNPRRVNPNEWSRGTGPPGQGGDQVEEDEVGGEWEHGNGTESVVGDMEGFRKVDEGGGKRYNSKRVDTSALAEKCASQQERRKRNPRHIPTPPNVVQNTMEHPEGCRNERVDEMIAQSPDAAPGGAEGEKVELRSAEVDWTRDNDEDGYYGTQGPPRGDGDGRDVETDSRRRDMGREGRVGVLDRSDDVERDWKRETDGADIHSHQERLYGSRNERGDDPKLRCRDPGPGGHLGEEVEPVDVGGDLNRENDGDGV